MRLPNLSTGTLIIFKIVFLEFISKSVASHGDETLRIIEEDNLVDKDNPVPLYKILNYPLVETQEEIMTELVMEQENSQWLAFAEQDDIMTSTANSTTGTGGDGDGDGIKTLYIVLGAVAIAIVVIIIIIFIYCCCCRTKKKKEKKVSKEAAPVPFKANEAPPKTLDVSELKKDSEKGVSALGQTDHHSSEESESDDEHKLTGIIVQPQIHAIPKDFKEEEPEKLDHKIERKISDIKSENDDDHRKHSLKDQKNDDTKGIDKQKDDSRSPSFVFYDKDKDNQDDHQKDKRKDDYDDRNRKANNYDGREIRKIVDNVTNYKGRDDYDDRDRIRRDDYDDRERIRRDDYDDRERTRRDDYDRRDTRRYNDGNQRRDNDPRYISNNPYDRKRDEYGVRRVESDSRYGLAPRRDEPIRRSYDLRKGRSSSRTDDYRRHQSPERFNDATIRDSRYKEPYARDVRHELNSVIFNNNAGRRSHSNSYSGEASREPEPDYGTKKQEKRHQHPVELPRVTPKSSGVIKPREFKGPYGPDDLDEMNNPFTYGKGKQKRPAIN